LSGNWSWGWFWSSWSTEVEEVSDVLSFNGLGEEFWPIWFDVKSSGVD